MKLRIVLILLLPALIFGCGKSNTSVYNPIPYATVNFQLDINSPSNTLSSGPGGFAYVGGQGYKGVLVICDINNNIDAFDRACPYNYTDPCAILTVRTNNFDIACGSYVNTIVNNKNVSTWEPCCGSEWNYDGSIKNGPTTYTPKRYTVTQSGTTITVTN